MLGFVLNTA